MLFFFTICIPAHPSGLYADEETIYSKHTGHWRLLLLEGALQESHGNVQYVRVTDGKT